MAEKKYYWLKLKEDFFEQDDIKLLEGIPNGKDYIIFYLKLLCKSLKDGGNLRYKGVFPYTPEMLASTTGTNIDIVHGAIEKLKALSMIDVLDDGALFMLDVENMTGQETAAAERMRRKRAKEIKSVTMLQECSEKFIDIDIEKEKDKELEKEKNNIIDEFETLWKMYPNKKGKDKALVYYQKARKCGTTYEEVEQGIKNYCKEIEVKKTSQQYIKHGSTWFNNKGWLDEYDITSESNQTNQPKQKDFNFIPTGIAESGEEYMEIDGKWFNRYGKELNSKGYEIIDFGLSKGW